MPSPQATRLTSSHRRELAVVARVTSGQVQAAAAQADVADVDAWWDRQGDALERIVRRGFLTAAALSSRYLIRHSTVEGVPVSPVRAQPSTEQIATSLHVTGPVAFKTHMADSGNPVPSLRIMTSRLAAAAQRLTLAGDRLTVMGTIRSSRGRIAGYRRITRATPCAFCAMLASRGAVYSETTVDFQAHDSCGCSPEPLYERETEPPDVVALRAQWNEATAGLSGAEALAAFRRARAAS